MRVRLKPWQSLLLIAAAAFVIVYGIHRARHSVVPSDADLIGLLPRLNATLLYADFSMLRRIGVLGLLDTSKTLQEADYQEFVRQTGFEFGKDIDSLAASSVSGAYFFAIRGRFNWRRLRTYAEAHGGSCNGDFCSAPTSKTGRWASFFPVDPTVMALAIGADKTAAYLLSPRRDRVSIQMPPQPIWISVEPAALQDTATLPPGLQLFAVPLAQADHIVFSVGGSLEAWTLLLEAECDSPAKARSMRDRLDDRTSMLKRALTRASEKPSAADLTGLVAEGTFQCSGRRVTGSWPLHKELLNALR